LTNCVLTGGRNGYGAKLCNIFSTKFIVETSSKDYKKAFKQVTQHTVKETTARQKREENKFGEYVCVRTRQSGDRTS